MNLTLTAADEFRRFFSLVEKVRERVSRRPPRNRPTDGAPEALDIDPLQAPLLDHLRLLAASAPQDDPARARALERLSRLLAAFADEVFIGDEATGSSWQQRTLEQQLFGTSDAEYTIFQDIERLVDGVEVDPELARAYALTLVAGYRGRYRDEDFFEDLLGFRRRLHELAWHGAPPDETQPVFAQAYAHTRAGGAVRLLPDGMIWPIVALVAIVSLEAVSAIIWWNGTTPLREWVNTLLGASP